MSDCGCVKDAPEPVAKVRVSDDSGPVMGVQVIFQRMDGTLVADTTTDATGIAQAMVEPGATATAIDPLDGRLHSWVGIKPGDTVYLHRPNAELMDATITVPANGGHRNYEVATSCGDQASYFEKATVGATVTFTMSVRQCSPALDFRVYSDNGDGGGFVTFFARNVTVTAGQPIALTGTYEPFVDVNQSFANLGTTNPTIDVGRLVTSGRSRLFEVTTQVGVVNDAAGGVVSMPTVPPGFLTVVFASFAAEAGFSQRTVFEAPAPAQYTLNAAGIFLPEFTSLPQFEVATQRVSWSEGATGAAPDFSVATIFVSRPSTKSSWEWFIAAPHSMPGIRLPILPSGDWNPVATDSVFVGEVATAGVPGGWDAARPLVAAIRSPQQLTGNGRIVLERSLQLTLDRPTWAVRPQPRRR